MIQLLKSGLLFSIWILASCSKDPKLVPYKTENLVLVVIDGPRYSETWGDTSLQYIPEQVRMAGSGVLLTNFRNEGLTTTNPGHTALLTGIYQPIDNSGLELPDHPSFLQYWEKQYGLTDDTWLITSKDKLQVLANCKDEEWKDQYIPNYNCGIAGLGTGYREDSVTYALASSVLRDHHPRLCVIQFKQPDAAGHTGVWTDYLQGIRDADHYAGLLFDQVNSDAFYAGKTAFIVTNDHGRHLDAPGGLGFSSHGDACEGCRRITLFAQGPDFKSNIVDSTVWGQTDLTATIAYLFGLDMPFIQGRPIQTLLR